MQIKQGTSVIDSFTYDALGRRQSKSIDGAAAISYLYDGVNPVQFKQGSAVTPILTGLGVDQYFARPEATGAAYMLTDAQGSVIALTDSVGALIQQYHYGPYGEANANNAGITNPFQYTGRENDGDGLYYYRARYYLPSLKRFISEDPIGFGGGLNEFAYVEGDPISLVDPMGWAPGDSFSSAQAAATDALKYISSKSDRCAREYGGSVYKKWSLFGPPTYTYDEPIPLGQTGGALPMPIWHETDAMFHNHPLLQGYDYNHFSFDDKDTADADDLPSYLLTPNGTIKRYMPNPGDPRHGPVTNVGQTQGCGCTQ